MIMYIYFSEKTTYTAYWTRCGVGSDPSWPMSYACLYTTRRLLKQLCSLRNKNDIIRFLCIR